MTRRVFSSQRSITNAALNLEAFVQTSMRSVLLGSVCSSEVLRRFNVLTAGILLVDKGLHGESNCPSLSSNKLPKGAFLVACVQRNVQGRVLCRYMFVILIRSGGVCIVSFLQQLVLVSVSSLSIQIILAF